MKLSFYSKLGFLVYFFAYNIISIASETGPCGKEGVRLCPSDKFGEGKMFECLSKQKEKLSRACKNHIEKMEVYKFACQKEISEYCHGQPFYCLYDIDLKKKKISSQCKVEISK